MGKSSLCATAVLGMMFVLSGGRQLAVAQVNLAAKLETDVAMEVTTPSQSPPGQKPSVLLTWKASKPATTRPDDAVVGYYLYRSTKPHDKYATQINTTPWPRTEYTDRNVEPGKHYFYVCRGVSKGNRQSGPSNQADVRVVLHPHD